MERMFLDSSAVVKYYVQEPGSSVVERLFLNTPADQVYVAVVTGAEVVAALKRTERTGVLTSEQADAAIERFSAMWQTQLMIVEVDTTIVEVAMQLARRHDVRGYDAVQLACAVDLARSATEAGDTVVLWSSDLELLAAARAEGIQTFNPAQTTGQGATAQS
jgi:predicted nucleic acid-binding protein